MNQVETNRENMDQESAGEKQIQKQQMVSGYNIHRGMNMNCTVLPFWLICITQQETIKL